LDLSWVQALHTASDAGRYFEVPAAYVKHYLTVPAESETAEYSPIDGPFLRNFHHSLVEGIQSLGAVIGFELQYIPTLNWL
jgi:hypothetical protein